VIEELRALVDKWRAEAEEEERAGMRGVCRAAYLRGCADDLVVVIRRLYSNE
jgi:hypothetical protein